MFRLWKGNIIVFENSYFLHLIYLEEQAKPMKNDVVVKKYFNISNIVHVFMRLHIRQLGCQNQTESFMSSLIKTLLS